MAVSTQPAALAARLGDVFEMCQHGDLAGVEALVKSQGVDVNIRDKEGITCLHWAAINNRASLCQFLLEHGANVNATGGELQATPLQWAVRYGHLPTVQVLMRFGANPSIPDCRGLLPLHDAARHACVNVVAYLVAKGVDIDATDAEGRTPLMLAAKEAHA